MKTVKIASLTLLLLLVVILFPLNPLLAAFLVLLAGNCDFGSEEVG